MQLARIETALIPSPRFGQIDIVTPRHSPELIRLYTQLSELQRTRQAEAANRGFYRPEPLPFYKMMPFIQGVTHIVNQTGAPYVRHDDFISTGLLSNGNLVIITNKGKAHYDLSRQVKLPTGKSNNPFQA